MNKRQRKKFATLDASGVKEIARMQDYITNLENCIWRMAMATEGKDDLSSMPIFTESGSREEFSIRKIYDFIKEHKVRRDEILQLQN